MARSPVVGRRGMVVSGYPLASLAGLRILEAGGSAVDAAIAASAVLATVMQHATSPAGDVFALIHDAATGTTHGLNGSGPAPALATLEAYRGGMPMTGVRSSTVPGIVGAWQAAHDRFGRLPWKRLFDAAIDTAGDGFAISPAIAHQIRTRAEPLAADPGCAALYLPGGLPLAAGAVLRQPALARTLQEVADGGAAAYYQGGIAASLDRLMVARDGLLRAADMKDYAPEWTAPIAATYRGATVEVMPPNSFGLLLLLQLNGLSGIDPAALDTDGPQRYAHLMAATRLAFAHGEPTICDPRAAPAPLDRLLGPDMTRVLQDGARGGPAGTTAFPTGGTSTLSVADAAGNAVTFVQSVFDPFGAFVLDPDTGLVLNNRMARFSTDPTHANVVAPGKRPAHTLNPVHVKVDGRPRWLLATPGAHNQTISIAQIVSNLLDRKMDLAAAVEAPRWTMEFGGPGVFLEDGIPEAVVTDLVARGHAARRNAAQFFGSAETIELTPGGAILGVADPRRDAYAAGW